MNTQEHLLTVLSEEAAEVSKCVSKALRFGIESGNPFGEYTNKEELEFEIADFMGTIQLLIERNIINPYSDKFNALVEAKKLKIILHLELAKSLGTVE